MARFLSPAWFAQLSVDADHGDKPADVVLQQVVTDTPEGVTRYQVSVRNGRATIHHGSPADADMTFTSDYTTATAIASGSLSTEAALSEGRLRVSGNLAAMAENVDSLDGVDPLHSARGKTEFDDIASDFAGGRAGGDEYGGRGDA